MNERSGAQFIDRSNLTLQASVLRVSTARAVLTVVFFLNAELAVNCGGSIAPEKGPRSKNSLTVATRSGTFIAEALTGLPTSMRAIHLGHGGQRTNVDFATFA
jgi:hypothetical protein